MFKGFNLENFTNDFFSFEMQEDLKKQGLETFLEAKNEVEIKLKDLANYGTELDGAKIQKSWFPTVNADVFLSHSHKDKDLALMLAGWLYKHFGLRSFIDSAIWGYSDDLLQIIDNKHCWLEQGVTYDYKKRNKSTSHVHMMLTSALGMMIDKTECLIFLNTPQSITAENSVSQTLSPWIYAELTIAGIVKETRPVRYNSKGVMEERSITKGANDLEIKHTIHNQHIERLKKINNNILKEWKEGKYPKGISSLDGLYYLVNK